MNSGTRQRKLSQSKKKPTASGGVATRSSKSNKQHDSSLDYSSTDLRHHLNRINNRKTRLSGQNNMSPRQTSGRRPQQSQSQQQQRQPLSSGSGAQRAEPLKFEGEFDFEQANARFEQEIEKEFTDKLKISDTNTSGKQQRNRRNSKTSDKQQQSHDLDSSLTNSQSALTLQDMQDQHHILMKQKSLSTGVDGHSDFEHRQSSHSQHNTMSAEEKNFYDKNISFFDRISCESNEKMQSKERKNWKEERKMNAETFGLMQRQGNDMMMMKSNYTRTYNNSNRYNNQNSGRNYPRNYNSSGQQQQQQQQPQYRSSNSNSMRQPQSQNQRMTVGSGGMSQRNSNYNNSNSNYRRNDMDVSYNNNRGGQRRFGSR